MSAAPPAATGSARLRDIQRLLVDQPVLVLIAILILLLGATDIASPGFVSPHQLSTSLLNAAPLGVLAAGQTLVILTGGIDLSVTNTATASAYVMALLGNQGTPLALAVALALGLVVGTINGIGIGIFGVQPLIMTLGMASVEIGALTVISQTFNNGAPLVPEPIHQLGSGTILGYVPINLLLWAPLALLIILGLRRTGFGRMVYAAGDNPLACRLAGVRVWQVLLTNYALCGLLSGLGGVLVVGFTDAADLGLATSFLLPSIAAVVIGGTSIVGGSGGYSGTILGAMILTVLDSLLNVMSVSQALRQMIYGIIVLVLAWVYVRTAGGE